MISVRLVAQICTMEVMSCLKTTKSPFWRIFDASIEPSAQGTDSKGSED